MESDMFEREPESLNEKEERNVLRDKRTKIEK